MKVLVALLLVAVASASISGFIQKVEQDVENFYQEVASALNINVTVNYTALALGFNQELNIVTDANGLACVATVGPTFMDLEDVLGTIQNFEFGMTFEDIKPLISTLNSFDADCQPAYSSYAEYFLDAFEAYDANKNVFVHTVLEGLIAQKAEVLAMAVEFGTQIAAQDSTSAGETLAKFVQLALAQWL